MNIISHMNINIYTNEASVKKAKYFHWIDVFWKLFSYSKYEKIRSLLLISSLHICFLHILLKNSLTGNLVVFHFNEYVMEMLVDLFRCLILFLTSNKYFFILKEIYRSKKTSTISLKTNFLDADFEPLRWRKLQYKN